MSTKIECADHGYIKALSVRNIAEMVYARQVFSETGMPPGLHLAGMYGGVVVIPDKGWIVWYDTGNGEPVYETMSADEFSNRFTPYEQLPEKMRDICDAHPGYDEWCDIKDRQFDAAHQGGARMLTNTELSAIRARCEAATPGPWVFDDSPFGDGLGIVGHNGEKVMDDGSAGGEYAETTTMENMRFICAAKSDIRALLAYIEAQKKEIEELRRALEWIAEKAAYACSMAVGCPFAAPCPANGVRCLDVEAEDWLEFSLNVTKIKDEV